MTYAEKLGYFWLAVRQRLVGQNRDCPYCASSDAQLLGRKKLVLELLRCRACKLMYRYPKDDPEGSLEYYQAAYTSFMTTDVSDPAQIAAQAALSFRGTQKDFSDKISILKTFRSSGRALDYGSSWGYGTLQLRQSGFDAVGYEVSVPRARFGREQLGVEIIDSREQLVQLEDSSFDVIFCNHVLEHVANPREVFEDWKRLLKPSGVLLLFVPNGGGKKAQRLGVRWPALIGQRHPLAIDAAFLSTALPRHGFWARFQSSPYPAGPLDLKAQIGAYALPGDELVAVVQPLTSAPAVDS